VSEAMLERSLGSAEAVLGAEPVLERAPLGLDRLGQEPGDPNPYRRRHVDRAAAELALPRGDLSPFQRAFRNWVSRTIAWLVMKPLFRVTVVNPQQFGIGPALYCFNHLSWLDTVVVIHVFPKQPRLYMYGPKEENIHHGGRNRFMWWTGLPVPFSPNKDDVLTSVRWAQAVFDSGGVLAIAAEGRIHVHEGDLLPFQEGAAYLALRAGVPIVPVAITGTSWARFRGQITVRLGEPIQTGERPTREVVARYTARSWHALKAMVADDRDMSPPGRIERWFTDWFNDWGPGGREAASLVTGPDPADVPYGPSAAD